MHTATRVHHEVMTEQTALMDDSGAPNATGDTGAPPPPPPPPHGVPRTPWYRVPVARDPDDDVLGGVVAGLCRAYGFDRRSTRIALVIASLVLPVIVLVYVVAWILLPDTPAEAQPLEAIVRDRRRFPLYAALALVIVVGGVGSLGSWFVLGDVPWGIGLIAIGVLLWLAPSLRRDRTAASPPPSSSAGESAAPETARTDLPPPVAPTPGAPRSDTTLSLPSAPTRRRRVPIGSVTVLLVIALTAVAGSGDALGWWDVPTLAVVVAGLVTLSVGLALSSLVNRAWFLLPLIVVLATAAGFLVIADPSLDGGAGDRVARPSTIADAEERHDLGAGQLTLDLRDVTLEPDTPLRVTAEVGVGRLHVLVPAGAELVVRSEVGAGRIVIDGREVADGIAQRDARTIAASGDRLGTIELDVRTGIGEVDVDHLSDREALGRTAG